MTAPLGSVQDVPSVREVASVVEAAVVCTGAYPEGTAVPRVLDAKVYLTPVLTGAPMVAVTVLLAFSDMTPVVVMGA